ncbi:hypothetical protein PZJ39_12130, partial [Staphylococcus capitis]|nr:hypothetical protein [Staphylococcus capitis]
MLADLLVLSDAFCELLSLIDFDVLADSDALIDPEVLSDNEVLALLELLREVLSLSEPESDI